MVRDGNRLSAAGAERNTKAIVHSEREAGRDRSTPRVGGRDATDCRTPGTAARLAAGRRSRRPQAARIGRQSPPDVRVAGPCGSPVSAKSRVNHDVRPMDTTFRRIEGAREGGGANPAAVDSVADYRGGHRPALLAILVRPLVIPR